MEASCEDVRGDGRVGQLRACAHCAKAAAGCGWGNGRSRTFWRKSVRCTITGANCNAVENSAELPPTIRYRKQYASSLIFLETVSKRPRGAVNFRGELLTSGIGTTETEEMAKPII
ncbi:hypothetical protein, partial [Burkholderia vietnamiensis]